MRAALNATRRAEIKNFICAADRQDGHVPKCGNCELAAFIAGITLP